MMMKELNKLIVKDIFNEIGTQIAQGKEVNIKDFGKFEVKDHSGRIGVNPSNGERIAIETTKLPTFKASGVLKASVNQDR